MNGSGGGGMENAAETSPLKASNSAVDFALVDLDFLEDAGRRLSSRDGFGALIGLEYVDAGLVFFCCCCFLCGGWW